MRFFWSELKWGGNGGERKRNFRFKKTFFLFSGKVFFFFLGKYSGAKKVWGFHFNDILIIWIIG